MLRTSIIQIMYGGNKMKINILGWSDSEEDLSEQKVNKCRKFENIETGEHLTYHAAKTGKLGHQGHDHYHRSNPKKTNWKDEYLDANGNPVHAGDDLSHLYPLDGVWWDNSTNEVLTNNYLSFFHDGAIIAIEYKNSDMIISMQSAQVHKEQLVSNLELSRYNRIKGKLHLEQVASISSNGVPLHEAVKMLGDRGEIFDLVIKKHEIELQVDWVNYPPKVSINEFVNLKIEALKIWWENIPDLLDPYW